MKNIVVVDDDPDILEAIQLVLEDAGYNVQTSQKGEFAEQIHNQPKLPDLLILDVLLSGKDGRVICHKLKSQKQTQKLPILMISAHPSARETVSAVGADGFLPKPFDIDILLEKVHKSLQTSN